MGISSSRLQEPTTACYCWQGTSPSYFSYHLQFSCYYIVKKKSHFFSSKLRHLVGQVQTYTPHPLQIQKDNKDLAF